jgi:hypothetical protein
VTGEPLQRVLEATGYVVEGQPAPGVQLGEEARRNRRGRYFSPEGLWRGASGLTVYFKFESTRPADELVAVWRQEVWNEGFAPLLWLISPEQIDLYNGFSRPVAVGDAVRHRLRTFQNINSALVELDALAGRLAMETGQFWTQAPTVDRKTSVDQQLLSDIALLERDLVNANLHRADAQALIGRCIFTQYLIDRKILDEPRLQRVSGHRTLPATLRDRAAAQRLFAWLSEIFNGDMFPRSAAVTTPRVPHLNRVADFLEAVNSTTGQTSLFPYQFNVIPVELISSIYEQFAHAAVPEPRAHQRSKEAAWQGVYYTRLPVVSLVLDEMMQGLSGSETVLDLTCGSGVFLVEALRRLVQLKTRGREPTREMIRSTLYDQVFGVDVSEAAIRVAAFSLEPKIIPVDSMT